MCELTIYFMNGEGREKVMESVVRMMVSGENVLLESILGEIMEVTGRIIEVNIAAQQALIARI
jgi:predicted RNA-binding protein